MVGAGGGGGGGVGVFGRDGRGRILVAAVSEGGDGGIGRVGRVVGVGEALAEIDRIMTHAQGGDYGEDGRRQARQQAV